MIRLLTSILLISFLSPTAMASHSPKEFESMYPAKCFEVDQGEKTTNKTSFCRMRRLRFYRNYLSKSNEIKKGSIAQTYTMIKTRESIKYRW